MVHYNTRFTERLRMQSTNKITWQTLRLRVYTKTVPGTLKDYVIH